MFTPVRIMHAIWCSLAVHVIIGMCVLFVNPFVVVYYLGQTQYVSFATRGFYSVLVFEHVLL
jgi:hypothetical protein